ncbi:hypothetical protein [Limnobaculum xujianqingii]|uniref:hypothetical protein n=1 Tax=Limnobaculum xujianqingii TaxID=2738837 RepID=UPI00112A2815|nr:hypothetical protein [Limnobaculum xujianqingii]
MVSSWLKTLIAIVGMTASFYSAATIPDYDKAYGNTRCHDNHKQYKAVREKISQLGQITDSKVKQLTGKPTLGKQFNFLPNLLMIPFPQKISDRVNQDKMYGGEFADKLACVQMFEIDYHKIAYHLFYRIKGDQIQYHDIGTVIVADNKKKDEFLSCKEAAKNIIEHHEKQGEYRKSYLVGIGIPFGFNRVDKFNKGKLNGVPSNAVQCQMKALPRENAKHEYILYYTWETTKKARFIGEDKIYINVRIVDEK